jgi:Glycosyl Hydrolase Family 88
MSLPRWITLLSFLAASCSDDVGGAGTTGAGGKPIDIGTGGEMGGSRDAGGVMTGSGTGGGSAGFSGEGGSAGVSGEGGAAGASDGGGGASAIDAGVSDRFDGAGEVDAHRACDAGRATDWGRAVVDSTIKRFPDAASLGTWGYQPALFLHGAYLVYERTRDARYLAYIRTWVDSHVDANGNIDDTLSWLDDIMPGNVVLDLYMETKDPRYKAGADRLRKRFDTFPRTSDGGFWHNTGYVGQTWGDGVFMSCPFLARYGAILGDAGRSKSTFSRARLAKVA